MHKKKMVYVLLTGALLLGGCMGGGWGGGWQMPPTLVETAAVTVQPIEDRFETVGTLEAEDAATLVAEIGGIVIALPFREGGPVQRGELIAQLDDRELRAELDRANAVKEQAQLNHQRIRAIVEQGADAQQSLDNATANLRVAEANAAYAEARFGKTRITAPFSGIVGARRVSVGSYVQPGAPIADLARVQELRVRFTMPERYLAQLKRGSAVSISTTAYPGLSIRGTIEVVEPQVETSTRNLGIVARVSNPENMLRPGMSANVAVVLNERSAALTVPSEAVVIDQNQPVVYVVKPDCTVARTVIELGSRMPDIVEVVSGLPETARIVRAGHQKVFDGAKVIPVSSLDSLQAAAGDTAATAGVVP